MSVEIWFIILLVVVLLMAELVRMSREDAESGGDSRGRARRVEGKAKRRPATPGVNYKLAPREPDVMAGALFDLLAEVLSYEQMVSFAGIVCSSETTERYIGLLAARENTRQVAKKLAFYNEAMNLNGYSGGERGRVASVLKRRADKQYKLLAIHRNLDKIL